MPIRIGNFVVAPLPRISYFSLARYLRVLEYGSVGGLVAGSIEKASKIPQVGRTHGMDLESDKASETIFGK